MAKMYEISSTAKSGFIIKVSKLLAMIRHPLSRKMRRKFSEKMEWRKREFDNSCKLTQETVPVFIISFNRLSYVKQIIEWLEKYNFKNINIIDNNSSFTPLLEYLKGLKYKVHYMDKNYGHDVLWSSGKFDSIIKKSFYIVSDPDIAENNNLRPDFIKEFYRLLGEYPNVVKVGFALEKDDLPETETNAIVKKWEKQFWEKKLDDDLEIYNASIDTTFALYRPGKLKVNTPLFFKAIRVAGDFTAKHLPWYAENNFTEEDHYYHIYSNSKSATWSKNVESYRKAIE